MSYDFHLIAQANPLVADFERACAMFENKFTVTPAGESENYILTLADEELALISAPRLVQAAELQRIFGDAVARQLHGPAWVSEINCPMDKDTAEAVRTFLMITVHETRGVVVDPQSRDILNALDA